MNTTSQTDKRKTQGGQVMLLVALFMLAGSMVIVGGIMTLVKSQVRVMTELSFSKASYILAEGALEEVVYRHKNALLVSATETMTENNVSVSTETTNIPGGIEVLATGDTGNRVRKIATTLIEGDGVSFSFGVQTDVGGFILENSSSVDGNVYSNGPIIGSNHNQINGTAISAGPTGFITEIHATGSAYAHELNDSEIDEDAFYTIIDLPTETKTKGTLNPGSPDLATTSLPLTEEILDTWEEYASSSDVLDAECAAAGGTIDYGADVTLGPAKIPCNVIFSGNGNTTTIAGVLWIEGDLSFTQTPEFKIHSGIGNKSVPIIVDNPADRLTSSRVTMDNSGIWTGNGDRSYILIVSRNESAENGGPEKAIKIKNSTGGDLLVYAGHGEINLQNNTDLTEISAWRVRLENLTKVIYDSGLASAVFTAGPGGSYVIDTWQEVE